jgi:RHS repeat-associated protein
MSYDPTIARWTTEDPDGYAGSGANLYEFVGSNPMSLRDPSGRIAPQIAHGGQN